MYWGYCCDFVDCCFGYFVDCVLVLVVLVVFGFCLVGFWVCV